MIIMILGMHRSGTSTVAGVLHMNKVVMGTYQNFWPRPLKQNPKGFYENYDFRKINDDLLNQSGYDVKSYIADIPTINIINNLSNRMEKLIQESNSLYPYWGWKDPRTCLTASHWANAINSLGLGDTLKIIFMVRKASSVSRSLNKRNKLAFENGMDLWKSYTERALKFCQDYKFPTFYCSFEQLLNNPNKICNSLFEFIGKDWDHDIVEKFIDSKISTSEKGKEIIYTTTISKLEEKIYSLVNNM